MSPLLPQQSERKHTDKEASTLSVQSHVVSISSTHLAVEHSGGDSAFVDVPRSVADAVAVRSAQTTTEASAHRCHTIDLKGAPTRYTEDSLGVDGEYHSQVLVALGILNYSQVLLTVSPQVIGRVRISKVKNPLVEIPHWVSLSTLQDISRLTCTSTVRVDSP